MAVQAPQFEGGSVIEVSNRGTIRVLDANRRKLRWSLGMGGPVSALAVDQGRMYVAQGETLRALSAGSARWSLALGQAALDLTVLKPNLLSVQLGQREILVDGLRGQFCTVLQPCSGSPSYSVGQIGVPFLDLPGLGVPGLGLILNPELFDAGYVSPGLLPGFAPAAPSAPPVRSRDLVSGEGVRFKRGKSGKVRTIVIGGSGPGVSSDEN